MHTDELRAELTELADEVAPFTRDVGALRRRVSRQRIATALVAAVVAAAVLSGVAALTHSRSPRLHIAHSAKDVAPEQLRAFDAAVILPDGATADDALRVESVLADTDAVTQYASLPVATLAFDLGNNRNPAAAGLRTRVCADPSTRSFAVTLAHAVPDALEELTAAIGTHATVLPFANGVSDIEVFMQVKASETDVAAVRDQIASDPDIVKSTFLDHQAAFEEFKRFFADQPVLVQNETPEGLPESFRLDVRDGAPLDPFDSLFKRMAGVKQVLVRDTSFWWIPQLTRAGDIQLFMQVKATDAQIAAVRNHLKDDPRVDSYRFVSETDAFRESLLFGNLGPGTGDVTPAALATSFGVVLHDQSDRAAFQHDYEAVDGVKRVRVSDGGLTDACAS